MAVKEKAPLTGRNDLAVSSQQYAAPALVSAQISPPTLMVANVTPPATVYGPKFAAWSSVTPQQYAEPPDASAQLPPPATPSFSVLQDRPPWTSVGIPTMRADSASSVRHAASTPSSAMPQAGMSGERMSPPPPESRPSVRLWRVSLRSDWRRKEASERERDRPVFQNSTRPGAVKVGCAYRKEGRQLSHERTAQVKHWLLLIAACGLLAGACMTPDEFVGATNGPATVGGSSTPTPPDTSNTSSDSTNTSGATTNM